MINNIIINAKQKNIQIIIDAEKDAVFKYIIICQMI